MKVQILSRKLITPSSPTPPHLQNLKISFVEQTMPAVFSPFIFYYLPAEGEEDRGGNIHEERSKMLQKSLAETLTLFYPLGGRYNNDNLSVDCKDKGAEYLEAKVSGCDLAQLLQGGELDTELRNHLIAYPNHDQPDNDKPLMIVQVNMFACGGLVMAINLMHKITDGFTGCTFSNAWATACRIGIEEVDYSPRFQLASFCPPKDILTNMPGPSGLCLEYDTNIVNKRFVFNGAAISKLKAFVAAAAADDSAQLQKQYQPTRVEVVTALVWRNLIKVSQAKHGHLRPSYLSLSFNMRGKTAMPIPRYCCGFFVNSAIVQFMPNDHDHSNKMELHDFVDRVHDAIESTAINFSKVSSGDDLFLQVTSNLSKRTEAFSESNNELDFYDFSSWCRFPFYEVDFGWGKPTWVSSMLVPKGMVLLVDTKDGDGIEVFLGLDGSSMLLFQQNLDSMGFTGLELEHQT